MSQVRDHADAEFIHIPHAALRWLVGRRRDTAEHLSFRTGTQVLSRSGCGTHSALRSLPARRAARSVPRATIDVGDRGMALPHIREDCAWTQGSHHTHQWLVSAWGILNFSSSIIVWRSTGLFRADVPGIRRTFLHRHHEATRSSVGCSPESVFFTFFSVSVSA